MGIGAPVAQVLLGDEAPAADHAGAHSDVLEVKALMFSKHRTIVTQVCTERGTKQAKHMDRMQHKSYNGSVFTNLCQRNQRRRHAHSTDKLEVEALMFYRHSKQRATVTQVCRERGTNQAKHMDRMQHKPYASQQALGADHLLGWHYGNPSHMMISYVQSQHCGSTPVI